MWPYWVLFVIPALGILSRYRLKPQDQSVMLYFVGFLFSIFVGLRHEVGADWFNYFGYLEVGESFGLTANLTGSDPGYRLVNWLAGQLGFEIYFVNFICALALMFGVVTFARQQPLPWLTILVAIPYLIIVVGMGYTRQAAALGFAMAGIACLQNENFRRFAFWVIVGATFHKSAVLLLPLAALSAQNNRFLTYLWVGFLSLIVGYLFVFDQADALWEQYVEQQMESQGAVIRVTMNVLPAVLYLYFCRSFTLPLVMKKFWLWISLLSLACVPLVFLASTATDRVALYFIPLQLFLFSHLHSCTRNEYLRAVIVVCIVGGYALVQAVWMLFAGHSHAWLPYQTIIF